MSFPNVVYGDYGDEKVTSLTRIGSLPLGTPMVIPGGGEFVHAKANTAAALAPGQAIVQKAVAGTSVNLAVAADVAIGGRTILLTMPATTLCTTADQYKDGSLIINDETGEGHTYKIASSNTAAAAANATFTLEKGDGIKVAIVAGTSQVTIRENPYYDVLIRAAGTGSVGMPAGIAQVAVTAGYYCWLRRKGTQGLLAAGTLAVAGRQFACATVTAGGFQAWSRAISTADTAGASVADTTLSPVDEPWGYCEVAAAASTEYMVGNVQLP